MLAKRAIRPYAIRHESILDHEFTVDLRIGTRNNRLVSGEQPFVDPDLCDVKQIRASRDSQPVDVLTERREAAT